MIKVQEIVVDGVALVPFDIYEYTCKGCYFEGRDCTVDVYRARACDLFEGRRLKLKTKEE